MQEEQQKTGRELIKATLERHARRLATTAEAAVMAVCDLAVAPDEGGECAEATLRDAEVVFREIQDLCDTLARRTAAMRGRQAFAGAREALRVCDAIRAAEEGQLVVTREATVRGLQAMIAERSVQLRSFLESHPSAAEAENANGAAVAYRQIGRERDVLIHAADVI